MLPFGNHRLQPGRALASSIFSVALLFTLVVATYMRNSVWCDDARLWENSTQAAPSNARAHFNLGRIYQERGILDKALAQYHRVIELKPDYPDIHNSIGTIYYEQDREQETIREFELAVLFNPKLTFAHFTLASLYLNQGRHDEAEEHYIRALELKPSSPYAHNGLGKLYLLQGRIEDAIREFETALMFFPDFAEAWQNREQARQRAGRKDNP